MYIFDGWKGFERDHVKVQVLETGVYTKYPY